MFPIPLGCLLSVNDKQIDAGYDKAILDRMQGATRAVSAGIPPGKLLFSLP